MLSNLLLMVTFFVLGIYNLGNGIKKCDYDPETKKMSKETATYFVSATLCLFVSGLNLGAMF